MLFDHLNNIFRWMAKWLRRIRGLLCSSDIFIQYGEQTPECRQSIRLLRAAQCQNYETGLLETLHNSLQCLTYNAAAGLAGPSLMFLLLTSSLVSWAHHHQ